MVRSESEASACKKIQLLRGHAVTTEELAEFGKEKDDLTHLTVDGKRPHIVLLGTRRWKEGFQTGT